MRSKTAIVGAVIFAFLGSGCETRTAPLAPPPISTPKDQIRQLDSQSLHNLFQVSDRIFSGSSPEAEEAFVELKKLGVKTIISVDGAKPDAERAAKHGIRYVHVPIGYDGIPNEKVKILAKVVRDLPGPFYVHCHHGKHRGPAAVAAIQLCSDPNWDAAIAEEWMTKAGTDPKYTGLIDMPKVLVRPAKEDLDKLPSDFPASAIVPALAQIMVHVDERWDNLKLVKAAEWGVPKGHAEIDPPHEALQLVELYREAARLDSGKGAELKKLLAEAVAAAGELEQALRKKPVVAADAEKAFARSSSLCAQCHSQFRDKPRKP